MLEFSPISIIIKRRLTIKNSEKDLNRERAKVRNMGRMNQIEFKINCSSTQMNMVRAGKMKFRWMRSHSIGTEVKLINKVRTYHNRKEILSKNMQIKICRRIKVKMTVKIILRNTKITIVNHNKLAQISWTKRARKKVIFNRILMIMKNSKNNTPIRISKPIIIRNNIVKNLQIFLRTKRSKKFWKKIWMMRMLKVLNSR